MPLSVGFIGLGTMGMPMARNIIKAGFPLTAYNRTQSKAQALAEVGARVAASAKQLAAASDVIVTIVSDTPDVESVLLGPQGAIEGIRSGSTVIDMSTISPEATRKIALVLARKGCHMLDAPVSGGEQGAIEGTLSIMVGGDFDVLERCRPILNAMGKNIVHVGANGMGQTVKLMNQILVAGNLMAVVEALVFAARQGVDLEKSIDAIKGGAAGSWQLTNLAPRIIRRDFRPGFKVGLMKKDLKLVMEAATSSNIALPTTGVAQQMFSSLPDLDRESGTQALVKALERLSNVEVSLRADPKDDAAQP
jgi:2-hydroxy-3-oxopropionate reductase